MRGIALTLILVSSLAFTIIPLSEAHMAVNQGAYAFRRGSGTRGWIQQAKIVASDGAASRAFGDNLALSGDTAVVGCSHDTVGGFEQAGSAYVFVLSGTAWTLQAKLTASDAGLLDQFGASVAIYGNTIVVGASHDTVDERQFQGSAYIFVRSGNAWKQEAKLTAGDGVRLDLFGVSVAIDRETIVVGAPYDDIGSFNDQGSAYVFTRIGSLWKQRAKLTFPGVKNNFFGASVAISGKTIASGATGGMPYLQTSRGTAYVFIGLTATRWQPEARLRGRGVEIRDHFGVSVALHDDTLLVGAPYDSDVGRPIHGSAFVFVRRGRSWTQQFKLMAPAPEPSDYFGFSVSLDSSTAVIGAIGVNGRGAAYVFVRRGFSWINEAKLTADDGADGDFFGRRVAISGETLLVGSPWDDVGANADQGSAYFFVRSGGGTTWSP